MTWKHGGFSYGNHNCRCEICTAAHRENVRRARERRAKRKPLVHGRESTYTNWRCRCDECRQAHTDHRRAEVVRRRVDA